MRFIFKNAPVFLILCVLYSFHIPYASAAGEADAQRKTDLAAIQAALEKYYAAHGTYSVAGAGASGAGQGYVSLSGSIAYPKSITQVLYDERFLATPLVEDPIQKPGYLLYVCSAGQSYALSAALDTPSASDISSIKTSCNGTGSNGTYARYGKNYALRQQTVIIPEESITNPTIGDGIKDDTVALQKAIALAVASPLPRTILLQKTYRTTSNLQIVGGSDILITGGGTIHHSGTNTAPTIFHVMRGSHHITIQNLHLLGDFNYATWPANQFPFSSSGMITLGRTDGDNGTTVHDITIRNNTMGGCAYAAIFGDANKGPTGAPRIENLLIENNTMSHCLFGIFIYKNMHGVKILNNTINDMRVDGIVLDTRAESDSIPTIGSSDVEVRGNKIKNTGQANYHSSIGILAKGTWDRLVIDGNTVERVRSVYSSVYGFTQAIGIVLVRDAGKQTSDTVSITNNKVSDVAADIIPGAGGIYISGAHKNITVSNNTVSQTKGDGIHIEGASAVVAKGNVCTNCHYDTTAPGYSFVIGPGASNVQFMSNSIGNFTPQVYGGIHVIGSTAVQLSGNQIPASVKKSILQEI